MNEISRVLILHTSYQKKGGEDLVFERESVSLQKSGIKVKTLRFSNHDFENKGPVGKTFGLLRNPKSEKKILGSIRDFSPDIIHVHNPMFEIPGKVLLAIINLKIPVVQTLHNYRPLCIGANFWRQDSICTVCASRKSYAPGIRHNCYRGSKAASIALSIYMSQFDKLGIYEKISGFIALSQNQKELFTKFGFDREKIAVKPNYLLDPELKKRPEIKKDQFIFIGRLTEEKGILDLIQHWKNRPKPKLLIIGDGPLAEKLRTEIKNSDCIEWKAQLPRDELIREISFSKALLAPFKWEEPFGLVCLEALASGTPVIGNKSGAIPEIVSDDMNGKILDFNNYEEVSQFLKWIETNQDALNRWGENAIRTFPKKFLEKENIEVLIRFYNSVLKRVSQ